MTKFRLGASTYRVELDESDVRQFAERWPCFGERRPLAYHLSRFDPAELEESPACQWEAMLAAMPKRKSR